MAEFILNPRRAARAPARCRAAAVSSAGWFEAETEDIGSMGCQLVSPKALRRGDLIQLVITNEKLTDLLKVNGRIAWVSPQPPWRIGIAFDDLSRKESARWFQRLVSVYPGMAGYRKVPERIRAESVVYLGAPPRFVVDFTPDEAALLRAIGSGARVDDLMARVRDRRSSAERALFSLIARQAVTFVRGQAGHPDSWRKILAEVEGGIAVESLGIQRSSPVAAEHRGPTPAAGAPGRALTPAWQPAPRDPALPDHALRAVAGLTEPRPPPLTARNAARGIDAAGWTDEKPRPSHPPDFAKSGVGWRNPPARSPEAAAAFDRGVAELRMGNVSGAITLLRYALSLAPGDPEIAGVLGKLAFKDR